MASLNKVQLIGNVGNDPDIRNVQGGAKTASFRLATTTRYKDRNGSQQEDTEWHNITVWNGRAEFVEKYIRKGAELYIEGKLRTRQWTDQSGNKRFTTEIVADNIQILMDRRNNGAPANNAPAPEQDDLPIF